MPDVNIVYKGKKIKCLIALDLTGDEEKEVMDEIFKLKSDKIKIEKIE